jgi:hypothetical protein
MTSPNAAYEKAYAFCVKAVAFEKIKKQHVGLAIASLTEAGQFGSWLKKLFHREKVTIHLHFYERLIRIVEHQAAEHRKQADHIDALIRIAREKTNATVECVFRDDEVLRHSAPQTG